MPRKYKKKVLLVGIEGVYGSEEALTGSANAIETYDLEIDAFEGSTEKADIDRSTLGNSKEFHVGIYQKLKFKVRLAGSGAAGTAPAWGVLMRLSAWSETVTALTDTVYNMISSNEESGTLYYNQDGHLYKLLGARGSCKPMLPPGKFPYLEFEVLGLRVPITAAAMPVADLTAFQTPIPVNDTNTPTLTLHGYAAVMSEFSLDQGNKLVYRNVVGEESIQINDRAPSGSITIDEPAIATKDFFTIAENHTPGAFQMVHNATAGHIVQIDMPSVQLLKPKVVDKDGIASLQMGLNPLPVAGDDEMVLTIK